MGELRVYGLQFYIKTNYGKFSSDSRKAKCGQVDTVQQVDAVAQGDS